MNSDFLVVFKNICKIFSLLWVSSLFVCPCASDGVEDDDTFFHFILHHFFFFEHGYCHCPFRPPILMHVYARIHIIYCYISLFIYFFGVVASFQCMFFFFKFCLCEMQTHVENNLDWLILKSLRTQRTGLAVNSLFTFNQKEAREKTRRTITMEFILIYSTMNKFCGSILGT